MTIAEALIQKGKIEGLKEGEEKGIEKGKIEDAKKMLAEGFDVALITKITGLTVEEIEKLSK